MPESDASGTGWKKLVTIVIGMTALLIVLLTAFAMPAVNSGPHDIPIAVAGDPADAGELSAQLSDDHPGAYSVTTVAGTDDARELILDREVYGAVDLTGTETTMLLASAASSAVAADLTSLARELGKDGTTPVKVDDIRPFPDDDPNGAGLSAGALPVALGGWMAAVVLLMTVRGARYQACGAAGVAIGGGLGLTAMMQYGFGTLDGNYWLTAIGAALGVSAAAWTILGLRTLLGGPGLALGAVTLILLGNPLSGMSTAPELLPAGWGTLGQLLPPGATGSLLRSLAYFDGSGAATPLAVLSCWTLGGAAMFAYGSRRAARRVAVTEPGNDASSPVGSPSAT
ncbi:hypothetical protein DVA86_14940 [Streptomyces armeniacus]|uniref:ABC transporter permease n=1 Tax=Streptomyces armeniacus TaxID=83291 RepID=A0A345XQ42_9ACTN|nr:hypothetical protein [Streptomyces armeniacus]AXK33758.1 hypothetical protein DVA86_14940 [Streptomyces armeniacus]